MSNEQFELLLAAILVARLAPARPYDPTARSDIANLVGELQAARNELRKAKIIPLHQAPGGR